MEHPNEIIMTIPDLIKGDVFTDHRGSLSFVNDFDMSVVKRFYTIEHPEISVVRAWQGHQIEQKWFYVTKGRFLMAWVKPDNWESPSKDLVVETVVLDATESSVLHIPAGHANGFKALDPNSKIIVFSDRSLEDAKDDNYRFDASLWMDWE